MMTTTRSRTLTGLLALWLFTSTMGIARAGDFDTANQLYDAGKFSEAVAAYQKLVASGRWTANLFYNLGNAEQRLGDSGAAMLAYERALALEPAHPEARANLKLLRSQTGGVAWPESWVAEMFPGRNIDVFAVVAAVVGWVAIFVLASIVLTPRGEKAGRWFVFSLALVVSSYAVSALWYLGQERSQALVIERSAEVKLAPAETAQAAGALPAGTEVRVLTVRGEWTYCALPEQRRGWLSSKSLERVRLGES